MSAILPPPAARESPASRPARSAALVGVLGLAMMAGAFAYGSYRLVRISEEVEQLERRRSALYAANDSLDRVARERQTIADSLFAAIAAVEDSTTALRIVQGAERTFTIQEQTSRPRVYPHIKQESQRAAADRAAETLRAQGYDVVEVDLVGAGPSATQVRYFADGLEAEARRVAEVLNEQGHAAQVVRMQSGSPLAHLEIWFGG
jgi:type II secretory pathway pseudopilin PulG